MADLSELLLLFFQLVLVLTRVLVCVQCFLASFLDIYLSGELVPLPPGSLCGFVRYSD